MCLRDEGDRARGYRCVWAWIAWLVERSSGKRKIPRSIPSPIIMENMRNMEGTLTEKLHESCDTYNIAKETGIIIRDENETSNINELATAADPEYQDKNARLDVTIRHRPAARPRLQVADVEPPNCTAPRPLRVRKGIEAQPEHIIERRKTIKVGSPLSSNPDPKQSGKNGKKIKKSKKTSIQRYRDRLQLRYQLQMGARKPACHKSATRPFLPQHTIDQPTIAQPSTSLAAKPIPKPPGRQTPGLSAAEPMPVVIYPGRIAYVPFEAITKKREYIADLEDGQWHLTFDERGDLSTFIKLLD